MLIALLAPNSQTMLSQREAPRGRWGEWVYRPAFAFAVALMAIVSISSLGVRVSEFLYFQF
jgi:hypothetical protein